MNDTIHLFDELLRPLLGSHNTPTTVGDTLVVCMLLKSVAIAISFCFVIYILYVLFSRMRVWRCMERYLPRFFLLCWLFGFIVYDVGMCTEDHISLLRNAPMAVLHAFGMFLLESDVSAIHAPFHDNALYMGLFSLAHFFAAIVSLVFVIKFFGFLITTSLHRFIDSHIPVKCATRDMLYIFWGMNEATYLLAKSVIDAHRESHPESYRILIVRTNHDEEKTATPSTIDRLLNFLTLGGKDLKHLKDLCRYDNVYATSTYSDIDSIDTSTDTDLFRALRIRSVERFIRLSSKGVHIFLLSDDEGENIRTASVLKHHRSIISVEPKPIIHCHARRDSIRRVIEDTSLVENGTEVRVIDSSHLAVEELRSKPEAQPVHFVDIEPDGTVASPFNALVVGFGETGRDVTRFLYEFSAFVDKSSTAEHVVRSPFHCHIVDAQLDTIKAKFAESSSGAMPSLSFLQADYRSEAFYDMLSTCIEQLNYVVVSMNDDEQNITLAVDILRYAKKRRENLHNFCIYVRVYHQDRILHFQAIADHYNKSYGIDDGIRFFGIPKEIYTYSLIVSDEIMRQGARFYCNYEDLEAPTDEDAIKKWKARRKEKLKSQTAETLQTIRRMESQDCANAFHRSTKIRLARTMFGEEELQRIAKKLKDSTIIRDKDTTVSYHDKDGNALTELTHRMSTLAQTEHLRWNAAHELMGYVKGDMKDEVRLTHPCLTSWQQLPDDATRGYDFTVVDTTLRLYAEEKQREQHKS